MFMEEKPANAKACIFRCSRPQQAKEQGFKMQEIQNHRPHKNTQRNGKKRGLIGSGRHEARRKTRQ